MYRVVDSVRSTHGPDGAVVLDIARGRIFNLNRLGSKILELLKRGCSEREIGAQICREFIASPDVVERDVREFIELLRADGLVEERRSTDALC
jgi:hypothetical protein